MLYTVFIQQRVLLTLLTTSEEYTNGVIIEKDCLFHESDVYKIKLLEGFKNYYSKSNTVMVNERHIRKIIYYCPKYLTIKLCEEE